MTTIEFAESSSLCEAIDAVAGYTARLDLGKGVTVEHQADHQEPDAAFYGNHVIVSITGTTVLEDVGEYAIEYRLTDENGQTLPGSLGQVKLTDVDNIYVY